MEIGNFVTCNPRCCHQMWCWLLSNSFPTLGCIVLDPSIRGVLAIEWFQFFGTQFTGFRMPSVQAFLFPLVIRYAHRRLLVPFGLLVRQFLLFDLIRRALSRATCQYVNLRWSAPGASLQGITWRKIGFMNSIWHVLGAAIWRCANGIISYSARW